MWIFIVWLGGELCAPSLAAATTCAQEIRNILESGDVVENLYRAHMLELSSDSTSELLVTSRGFLFDGTPVQPFEIPTGHAPGELHSGLYSVQRNGEHHLIKVLDDDDLGRGENSGTLRSMLMAQQVGGPRVYHAGHVKIPGGNVHAYIEIEELFHGKPSKTLKGVYREKPAELIQGDPRPTDLAARLMVRAFEQSLAPDTDFDMIYSGGEAHWIDASRWEFYGDSPIKGRFVEGAAELIHWLCRKGKAVCHAIVEDLVREVWSSSNLPEARKNKILELLRKQLSVEDDIRQLLEPRTQPMHFEAGAPGELKVTPDGMRFDGLPVRPFSVPAGHDPGSSSVLAIERGGQHRLIKILDPDDHEVLRKMNDDVLRSMLSAQQVGGPKIYRAGHVRQADGRVYAYIEMEEFFHGRASASFKGAILRERPNDLIQGHPRPTEHLSRLIVGAFEHGLAPDHDIDIVYSGQEAHWIDASTWRSYGTAPIDARFVKGPVAALGRVCPKYPVVCRTLARDLKNAIEHSRVLSGERKRQIMDLILQGLSADRVAGVEF